MLVKNVDLPEPLLEAQEDGSLVVFAGAGVSMPPPSNFPNFDKLAEQVAAGVLSREQYETPDQFLGRLKDRGVKVHDMVRRILSDSTSHPNSLHTDILRLFDRSSRVRVVTTNFDVHFTTAAGALFQALDGFEVYEAPALPPGHSFHGIAHLHGSIAKPSERLVLTDSDFGAAYLTEGWARRFLQQLFAENVVLFVGYSHSESVIDYLARGLPPKGKHRFSLAEAGTEAHWKRLGISTVSYPAEPGVLRHAAVAPALKCWADLISTAALDHEDRIKSIVQQPVSLNPEDLDYIDRACKDTSLVRFFTRHATSSDWLRWAEGKGLLANLFRQTSSVSEIDREFAFWFARVFSYMHPDDALAVLQRRGGFIAPVLWYEIAVAFHSAKPVHEIVGKWIPLLLSSQPSQGSKNLLD